MDSPICTAVPGREAGLALARAMVDSLLREGVRWHYEHALLLYAALYAARAWDDGALAAAVLGAAESLVDRDGKIAEYRAQDYNLDNINPGRLLLDLAHRDRDGRFARAVATLEDQLAIQPRTDSGNYWHKAIYPRQVWLDGLYMAQPFRVRIAAAAAAAAAAATATARETEAVFDDVVAQFVSAAEHTENPLTGLLHHAWDESRSQAWADPETGRSPHAWGRALGWYCMAIVDTWEYLPRGHAGRGILASLLSRAGTAIRHWRDPGSGLWFQVPDSGSAGGNYLETSCGAMFAYAFMKADRLGICADPLLKEMATSAYRELCARKLFRDSSGGLHLGGTCAVAGLGGSPYRDGSFAYYVGEPVRDDDCKGTGPFILASIEYEAGRAAAAGEWR